MKHHCNQSFIWCFTCSYTIVDECGEWPPVKQPKMRICRQIRCSWCPRHAKAAVTHDDCRTQHTRPQQQSAPAIEKQMLTAVRCPHAHQFFAVTSAEGERVSYSVPDYDSEVNKLSSGLFEKLMFVKRVTHRLCNAHIFLRGFRTNWWGSPYLKFLFLEIIG